jgi:hypothetical protein
MRCKEEQKNGRVTDSGGEPEGVRARGREGAVVRDPLTDSGLRASCARRCIAAGLLSRKRN